MLDRAAAIFFLTGRVAVVTAAGASWAGNTAKRWPPRAGRMPWWMFARRRPCRSRAPADAAYRARRELSRSTSVIRKSVRRGLGEIHEGLQRIDILVQHAATHGQGGTRFEPSATLLLSRTTRSRSGKSCSVNLTAPF